MLANLSGLDPTKFATANLTDLLNALLPYIFGFLGFVVLAFLIVGGYQFMMSKGDPKALAQAQQTITYAIVGFIIVGAAYLITNLVGVTLDLQKVTNIFQ